MGCARVIPPISASSGQIDQNTAAYKPVKIPSNSQKLPSHSHSNLHCGWNMLETHFARCIFQMPKLFPPIPPQVVDGRGEPVQLL